MVKVKGIEWAAEQACGDCGEGVFVRRTRLDGDRWDEALCSVCGHLHPMDATKLGPLERFEWKHTTQARGEQTLHLVSYMA